MTVRMELRRARARWFEERANLGDDAQMIDEAERLWEQIERCRRLTGALTDPDLRESLQDLANEYEARLKGRIEAGFMLQRGNGTS